MRNIILRKGERRGETKGSIIINRGERRNMKGGGFVW